jgi:LytS/YehU family sensor histidine kinase
MKVTNKKNPWMVQGITFWHLNLLIWLAFGTAVFLVRWIFHGDIARALIFTLFSELVGFGFTLLLRPVYRKLDFEIRTAFVVAIFSLIASVVLACLTHLFADLTGWHNPNFTPFENFLLRILLMWMVFLGWSFGYFWLKTGAALKNETLIAEAAVREAQRMELQMLRAQLDPHFLFNSLNGIVAEISQHPDTASDMLRELSDYLRYSLDHRKKAISPLSDELEAMKSYLAIEKTRFGERLELDYKISAAAGWRQVPSFLLQPLVENAIKHGLHASTQPIKLSISATIRDGGLEIIVANTGRLAPANNAPAGVGLDTLRRRLDLHYPWRHSFEMIQAEGWVRASIILKGDPCCA